MGKKFMKNDLATYSSKAMHFVRDFHGMYDWYDDALSQEYFLIVDEKPVVDRTDIVAVYDGKEIKNLLEEDLEKIGE